MININDRLQKLYDIIVSSSFMNSRGLGNEVNFHVFDYEPENEYLVRDYVKYLLAKKELNIREFNIYDIIIQILKEKGFLGKVFEYEGDKGTKYVNNIIVKTLGISSSSDLIVNYIKKNVEENQIILITGIGNCWPIVRGHTILNNLQSVITKNPLIMMYPGKYDGQSFSLFDQLASDNYYRAFQIVSRK